MRIVIGQGSCGIAAGAEKVRKALLNTNINAESISITGCIGMCYLEPIVDIYDDDNKLTRLVKVSENDAESIARSIGSGDKAAVEKLIVSDEDSEFLSKQTRIALRNCGIINPDEIEAYINAGGYTALKKAICELTPEGVIDIIKTSSTSSRPQALQDAAAQASRHGSSGTRLVRARARKSTSSVTPTRATPARLWTER